jgi:hypothetical protein
MVIRIEYRGQRYTMGSSDPLPAGFEIRFVSLNLQATGNGYLMRITNRAKLHPWRSTGPGLVPAMPTPNAPAPGQEEAAGPSAPQCRRRSGQRSRRARMERRWAVRVGSQRDATIGAMATAPAGEHVVSKPQFPLACATPRWRTPRPPTPTWWRVRAIPAARPGG